MRMTDRRNVLENCRNCSLSALALNFPPQIWSSPFTGSHSLFLDRLRLCWGRRRKKKINAESVRAPLMCARATTDNEDWATVWPWHGSLRIQSSLILLYTLNILLLFCGRLEEKRPRLKWNDFSYFSNPFRLSWRRMSALAICAQCTRIHIIITWP